MKYTLVAGGSGLIGSSVVDYLIFKGRSVIVLDPVVPEQPAHRFESGQLVYVHGSTVDGSQIAKIRRKFELEAIYDLSGLLGTEECDYRLETGVTQIVIGSKNLMELAVEKNCRMFEIMTEFFAGRDLAYLGFDDNYTLLREYIARMGHRYMQNAGLKLVRATVHHAFGERQKLWPVRKLLPTAIAYAGARKQMKIFGSDEKKIDYVYAPDLGRIIVELTESKKVDFNTIYDIGGPDENFVKIGDVVKEVYKLMESIKEPYKVVDDVRKQPIVSQKSIDNWKEVIGDVPRVKFFDVLPSVLAWYRAKYTEEDFRRAAAYFNWREVNGV
jgi:nucleoside-diphosphate-sugar epimerase